MQTKGVDGKQIVESIKEGDGKFVVRSLILSIIFE